MAAVIVVATEVRCAATAPQGPATDVLCRFCGNHGEKDCPRHKATLQLERSVAFCSAAAGCKRCEGALTIDCKICTNPPVERGAAARRERIRDWLDQRRATVDAHTASEDLLHAKSAHVDLTSGLRSMTIGRRKLDSHRLMHLYLDRIEALRAAFVETFGLTDADFPPESAEASPRLAVFLFDDPRDHRAISPRVTGIGGNAASTKLMGGTVAFCLSYHKRRLPDDDALHRSVVHNVAHLLLSNAMPCAWIGNKKHGWIDEGVAHYFEYRVDERCANFCYEEVGLTPGSGFASGRWRVGMRKLLESGKLRSFPEIYQKSSDQLDFVDHAHAFAYVEYLIAQFGGPKFHDFVRRVKQKVETREALREVFGLSPLTFDEGLAAWIRATYPLQRNDR